MRTSDLGGKFQDPLDSQYYTYSTNLARTKYQVLALLENSSTLAYPGTETAYAATYDVRTPMVRGATLGVLVGTGTSLNQPIQETYSASFTGIDLTTTTTAYTAIFAKDAKISGTWSILKSMRAGGELANGLAGYWSLDDASGYSSMDNSGYGNALTLSWSSLPTWTTWKIGSGLLFGADQILKGPLLDLNTYMLGVTANVKLTNPGTTGISIAQQYRGCQDGFTPYKRNSWGFSISPAGYLLVQFNKLWDHGQPNVSVNTNLRITDTAYHYVAFSFNYGKVQVALDSKQESYDISSIDFSSAFKHPSWTPTTLGDTGRIYNGSGTSLPGTIRANIYDYTGNDWRNYFEGNRLVFDHFLKPEIPLVIGSREDYCGGIFSYLPSAGALDEVRIYNRPLSSTEIQSMYAVSQ